MQYLINDTMINSTLDLFNLTKEERRQRAVDSRNRELPKIYVMLGRESGEVVAMND